MKMLTKSNKGGTCVPPLESIINENTEEIVYEDKGKCELLNKYFRLIATLDDDNVPLPEFE